MTDIIILYEHPQRDLENSLILKTYLERIGFNTEIIKFPFRNPFAIRLKYRNKVKCVVTHSLYDESVLFNLVYQEFGKVPYIINTQCEQVHTNKDEKDPENYSWPKGKAREAYHVCWGERIAELLQNYGVKEERLIVSGPIQMDFLRSDFPKYFMDRKELLEKFQISQYKRVVLFISSFSYASLSPNAIRELSGKIGGDEVKQFAELSKISQKQIIEWLYNYAKSNSDSIIIYRKHPAEVIDFSNYSGLLELENLKFISAYSIKEWISNVDIILTWYSTSAAEAYFFNKGTYLLRPVNIPCEDDVSIFKDCKMITSYDEFVLALENRETTNLNKEIISSYYNVSDKPSFMRLGNEIAKIVNDNRRQFEWDKDTLIYLKRRYFQHLISTPLLFAYNTAMGLLSKMSTKNKVLPKMVYEKIRNRRRYDEKQKNEDAEINLIYTDKYPTIRLAVENYIKKWRI